MRLKNRQQTVACSRDTLSAFRGNYKGVFNTCHTFAGNPFFRFQGHHHILFKRLIKTFGNHGYFINVQANAMAKELTTKKEKKAFEIARQFTRLGKSYILDYSISAIASLDNFLSDHPGSIYREDAFYLKVEATTNLALNSTLDKKEERLQEARAAYNNLLKYYPETKYSKNAKDLVDKVDKETQAYKAEVNLTK